MNSIFLSDGKVDSSEWKIDFIELAFRRPPHEHSLMPRLVRLLRVASVRVVLELEAEVLGYIGLLSESAVWAEEAGGFQH
jgi:hypothetical protein